MNKKNELQVIEEKYNLLLPKVNEFYAWPLLRQVVYFNIFKKKFNFSSKLRTRSKIQLIKNFFFGFNHLFRLKKFDYLFFNNADKRTFIKEGKNFDVFFDAWADKLGQEKSLFVEWAILKHYSISQTHSKNVMSDLPFKAFCFFYKMFSKTKTENISIIHKINDEYDLNFDIDKTLKNRVGEVFFYRRLFRFVKPKAIFVLSSFTKETIVLAAHLENINVIEAQHGYIGENHQFYNSEYKFGKNYYPDFLISFGEREKQNSLNNFIFDKEQIIPVGSLYLESTFKYFENDGLKKLVATYNRVFCVSLQSVKEDELLKWVNVQAKKNKDWLFFLKPRHYHSDYNEYTQLDNCMLVSKYDIYQILKYSDYNITIYSTTSVEGESYGIKTLFYNIDGLSTKYFETNDMFCSVIEPGEDIIKDHLLNNQKKPNPYFIQDYFINVKNTKTLF